MYIFYTPDITTHNSLSAEESRHAVKVLRLKEGDEILQTDGKGFFYKTVIVNANPKGCQTEIAETVKQNRERDFHIHIAVAPTKNSERIEWFVEKACEIGIDEITFLRCRFSERKELKTERIEKILVSAMKQSQKAYLPLLRPIIDFNDFINRECSGQKFIAHCYENQQLPLKNQYVKNSDATVLIGPEGDFSPEEIKSAVEAGFVPVSLGKSRLRTETAALVACHTIHVINE